MKTEYSHITEIINLLNQEISKDHDRYGRLLLKEIVYLSNEFLIIKKHVVLCKYQYLSLWRICSINIESDILISAYLAKYSIENPDFEALFDWKNVIDHDNVELNNLLRQGIVDNHYHIGGSLPIFHSTWTAIMQNQIIRNQASYVLCFDSTLLEKAASIRGTFLSLLSRNGITISQKYKHKTLTSSYNEERELLFSVIREFLKNNAMFCSTEDLFYEYLLIKERYRRLFILNNYNVDVSDFFSVITRRNAFLNSCGNIDGIIRSGIDECLKSSYIDKMEIRISMKDLNSLCHCINVINFHMNNRNPGAKIRYIICFSRRKVENDSMLYRNQSKREALQEELNKLANFMNEFPSEAKYISGIDVSSREDYYNPEVFSELMNNCLGTIKKPLKRMYHVGEIFSDFLTGLRRIDECLTYFGLRTNDRLAHAVPVYANIRQWYCRHGNKVTITKEEYLDSITWMFFNLPKRTQLTSEANMIKEEFFLIFRDLYFEAINDQFYQQFPLLKKRGFRYEDISITHYYESWKLRNKKPKSIEQSLIAGNLNDNDVIAYFISYLYFYCKDVKEKGKQMIEVSVTPEYIRLVELVQEVVQKKIVEQGVCIEVCPSSSSFLYAVPMGYTHPIFSLYEKQQSNSVLKDICLSINTDDMDVFSTSLTNEYSLVANVYEMNATHNDKDDNFDKKSFYKWLNSIRLNSIKMFLADSYM